MPSVCALGCARSGVPLHVFPNPDKYPERFRTWVNIVSRKTGHLQNYEFYKTKRLCDIHFTDRDRNRNNRLNALAVPSLYLRVSTSVPAPPKKSLTAVENLQPRVKSPDIGTTVSESIDNSQLKISEKAVEQTPYDIKCPDVPPDSTTSESIDNALQTYIEAIKKTQNEANFATATARDCTTNECKDNAVQASSKADENIPCDTECQEYTAQGDAYSECTNDPLQTFLTDVEVKSETDSPIPTAEDFSDDSSTMYEGLICICCMSTENLIDLFTTPDSNEDHSANYARLLRTCFSIRVSKDEGHAHICKECSQQLRSCSDFKKQILNSISILSSVNSTQLMEDESNDVDQDNSEDNASFKDERLHQDEADMDYAETIHGDQADEKFYPQKKRDHPRESPYTDNPEEAECNYCGKKFLSESLLQMHACANRPKFQCEHCGKDFMTSIALNNHLMQHNEQYQCGNCTKTFSSLKQLGRHQENEHSNFDERGMYKCEFCNKIFRHSILKESHVQKKHEVVLFSCPLCSYKSKRKYLKSHMANKHHIGEKKHGCIYCGKKFSRAIALKEHVRIHLNDRRYVCRLCDKNFVHKCSLKVHIQSHLRRGEFRGDPHRLIERAERTHQEYEPMEGKMIHEEATVEGTEENQDGMIEEFLLEEEELDEIRDSLSREHED